MMPKVKVNTLFNRVKIQRAKNKWDKDRMKRLDFVNKRTHQKSYARAYINKVDEAMIEYIRVFVKWVKPLSSESQLSDFHLSLEGQKTCELLFFTVVTGSPTYAVYKDLK